MRKLNFSRKLHSILSITLSLVMLIGACFVVPVTTAMAEGTYLDSFGTFGTFARNTKEVNSDTLVIAKYNNVQSFSVKKKDSPDENGYEWQNLGDSKGDALGLILWEKPRYQRLCDPTGTAVSAKAGTAYAVTFSWLNPYPAKDGVPQNVSVCDGLNYSDTASIWLCAGAGKNADSTNKLGKEMVTLLDKSDFSSNAGNDGKWTPKTVYFKVEEGTDITDISLGLLNEKQKTGYNPYNASDEYKDGYASQKAILLDNIKFEVVEEKTATFTNMDGSVQEVTYYEGSVIVAPTPNDATTGSNIAWKSNVSNNIYKAGEEIKTDDAAKGFTAVYSIDFEGYTDGGKTAVLDLYDTSAYGATTESNKAAGAVHVSTYTGNESRYEFFKNASGANISFPAGRYEITYSYYWKDTAYPASSKPVSEEYRKTALAYNITAMDKGTAFEFLPRPGQTDAYLNEVVELNKWYTTKVTYIFTSNVTNFGLYDIYANYDYFVDNIVITPVNDIISYNDCNDIKSEDYVDGMRIPESNSLNFSHWVDSKGNIYNVGDPAVANESFTSVLKEETTVEEDNVFTLNAKDESVTQVIEQDGKNLCYTANKKYLISLKYTSDADVKVQVKTGDRNAYGQAMTLRATSDETSAKKYFYFRGEKNGISNVALMVTATQELESPATFTVTELKMYTVDLNDYTPKMEAKILVNQTDSSMEVSAKSISSLKGTMNAYSAVYNKGTDETPDNRSLLRFVAQYKYGADPSCIRIGSDLNITIRRGIMIGAQGATLSQVVNDNKKDKNGKFTEGKRLASVDVADKETLRSKYWDIDEETNTVYYSYAIHNISLKNSAYSFGYSAYLYIDSIIDLNAGQSTVTIRSDLKTASAKDKYDALSAAYPDTTWGWYE